MWEGDEHRGLTIGTQSVLKVTKIDLISRDEDFNFGYYSGIFDRKYFYLIGFQNIAVSLQYLANITASNVEVLCIINQPVRTWFSKTLNDETQLYRVCSAEYVVLTSHGPNIVTTAVPVSHCVPILRAMRITVSHSLAFPSHSVPINSQSITYQFHIRSLSFASL